MGSILFINCKVWQPDISFDDAFGIEGGEINFVGSTKEAKFKKKEYDEIIDLQGRLVLPGLTDGHLHLCYGSLMRKRLNCSKITSVEELIESVAKYNSSHKNSSWVIGSNLDIRHIAGGITHSTGNFTDKIFFMKPLFIANYDYHSALCNTLAMEQSGLLSKLKDFSEENIPKDSAGIPVGIIKEEALDFVFENLPEPSLDDKTKAVTEFIKILHSYGITTVTDITLPADFDIYLKLYEKNKLIIRINSYIPFEEFPNISKHEEYTNALDHDYFSINGFKAFYDGALGSATALFSENYKDSEGCGVRTEMAESGELRKLAMEIDKAGRQIIIHAIGDKAVTEVLDICETLDKENGDRDRRLRIEHAQHIKEDDFYRFKILHVNISAQPIHLKYDIKVVKQRLPDSLINSAHNYKLLIDRGVIVNFGTDFPIVEINPFENIQMALTRKTKDETLTPEYKIGLHYCIRAYTINNAYSNFNENAAGTIETGKVADFVIMNDNLFEMEAEKLGKAKVYKTYLNGKEVYSIK